MNKFLAVALIVLSLASSFGQKVNFRLYLIGDAGKTTVRGNGLHELLRKSFDESIPAGFVLLGDNIYPKGMPSMEAADRDKTEKILQAQVDVVKGFRSPVYFIPGNHDWNKGSGEGLAYIQNQQRYVDSLGNSYVSFLPKEGCPGPSEVHLSNDLVLVIIDSQWFLQQTDELKDNSCDCKNAEEVIIALDEMMRKNVGKRIVLAAHHPVHTFGEHGGVFNWKAHFFPLLGLNSSLYFPLPIVGSIYPAYRKWIGDVQDLASPMYKQYRTSIEALLKKYPETIFVSGHEHALEHIVKDGVNYVVSGSGVNSSNVRKKKYADFVSSKNGFARIDLFEDKSSSISYFEVGENGAAFVAHLPALKKDNNASPAPLPDFTGHIVTHASDRYQITTRFKRWALGSNYRAEWHQDMEVPKFDIGTMKGGMKITQKGGGFQTLSLRLVDSTGIEYTLRSIEKFPEKAVPDFLKGTFAQDIVQDQISASHPYGALVIPKLSKAAGIYYSNPELVFIPDDPRLGSYQKEFANTLALFDERPSGDGKGRTYFGDADKIVGADKVLAQLSADLDNQVDQEFTLRSRLFDMVIGDWDRHDDQWRWASFKKQKGTKYRPIPRDRDQAFFQGEGFITKIGSRKWAIPKFEGFGDHLRWSPGFNFNARYFDRSFLNWLDWTAWEKETHELQKDLADSIIDSAIKAFPQPIYQLHGDEIICKVKSRKNGLTDYARSHYQFLSKEVDLPGSNKQDWFDIQHLSNGNVKVDVFKITKDGRKPSPAFSRTFLPSETKEIRLYGLDGNDVFTISGSGDKRIRIRVIGGPGKDSLFNQSDLRIHVYDRPHGVNVGNSNKISDHTSKNEGVNSYDRMAFKYPRLMPLVYGNYNYDDGFFIGGGFLYTTHGFRKQPYKSKHTLLASFAPYTTSYNFTYDGRFYNVLGKWGVEVDADLKAPNFVNNFFGWGNETVFDRSVYSTPGYDLHSAIDYYRLRFKMTEVQVKLARAIGDHGFIKFGPAIQIAEIELPKHAQAYIYEYAKTIPQPFFGNSKTFTGLVTQWGVDRRDNALLPSRGVYITQNSTFMQLWGTGTGFGKHDASVSLYHSLKLRAPVHFAIRFGGGFNTGKFELYQAQILDGKTELRGFRKTRFYGDSKLYNNSEVRVKFGTFKSRLFPASFGINVFSDIGRVWYKNATGNDPSTSNGLSNLWHVGFGGGAWLTPFNLSVLSCELAHSADGNMLYARLGFLF
jgi:predicted phosphodiesterase